MSAAATASSSLQPAADPAAPPVRSRAGLLGIVRRLIDYGRQLASRLKQHGVTALGSESRFETSDLPLILARITRGLQLATALEAKLDGMKAEPKPAAIPLPRMPRMPAEPGQAKAPAAAADTRLPDMPTPEQIAALVRRKPIGAVMADICRDLGILPCHPLWRELQLAIITYGGNFARLVIDILDRTMPLSVQAAARFRRSAPRPATGPP